MAKDERARSGRAGDELALAAVVLAFGAASQLGVRGRAQILANLGAATAAVAFARSAGASWAELGLEPDAMLDGLRVGGTVAVPVCAALAAGVALPRARPFFIDERASGLDRRELAFHVLVRIPLATAAGEELLFRSALLGVGLHRGSRRRAIVTSSTVFGLWHVLPALRSHEANPAGAQLAERAGGRAASVVGTVAVTAVAGAGFAWLRMRSRSVVAPFVAHAAVNIAAFAAADVASRLRRRSGGR